MPNPENIKKHEFPKGVSGNPKGRPKGSPNRETIVRRWLDISTKSKNPITGKDEEMTQADKMVLALMKRVLQSGDVQAFKELFDSGFGKIKDQVENNITLDSSEEFKTKFLASLKANDSSE